LFLNNSTYHFFIFIIRARKQRTDIGKYPFVNRSIIDWNQLSEGAIGTSHGKTHIFKTSVRKCKAVGEVKAIKSKKLRQGK
jgi:hypothetical protein